MVHGWIACGRQDMAGRQVAVIDTPSAVAPVIVSKGVVSVDPQLKGADVAGRTLRPGHAALVDSHIYQAVDCRWPGRRQAGRVGWAPGALSTRRSTTGRLALESQPISGGPAGRARLVADQVAAQLFQTTDAHVHVGPRSAQSMGSGPYSDDAVLEVGVMGEALRGKFRRHRPMVPLRNSGWPGCQ
jgi:hypothetical protein